MKTRFFFIGAAAALLCAAVFVVYSLDSYGYISIEDMLLPEPIADYKAGERGTADSLEGKTVCVSVYVDLRSGEWDFENDADKMRRAENRRQLSAATKWISEKAGEYGKTAEFIFDYEQYPELYYNTQWMDTSYGWGLRNRSKGNRLWRFINGEIDSEGLLERFGADNIIYVTYYKTEKNEGGCPAFSKDCYFDPEFSYETIFIPEYYDILEVTETVVAHEILHLFGAPDWYQSGSTPDFFGVTSEFVDYMKENHPNDIMLTTFDRETKKPLYGDIKSDLSDITAYYIGLTDKTPREVYDFDLDLSEHDPNRPKYGTNEPN